MSTSKKSIYKIESTTIIFKIYSKEKKKKKELKMF